MMGDVPLGALLSGGVDSSVVVGTMSQLTSQPVKTFAVGFDVPEYSELPFARLVAEHFGTEHHELVVKFQTCQTTGHSSPCTGMNRSASHPTWEGILFPN